VLGLCVADVVQQRALWHRVGRSSALRCRSGHRVWQSSRRVLRRGACRCEAKKKVLWNRIEIYTDWHGRHGHCCGMRHWVRGHRHRVRRVDARVSGTTVARRQYRTERETRIHADLYTYHCTRLRKHIAHMNTWSGMNGGSIQRRGAFHTGTSQSCGGRPHGGREAARDGGGQRRRWHRRRRRRRCHRRAHERTQRLLRRGLRHSVSGGPPLRRVNNFGSFVFFPPLLYTNATELDQAKDEGTALRRKTRTELPN
jgi:hypothetical protein